MNSTAVISMKPERFLLSIDLCTFNDFNLEVNVMILSTNMFSVSSLFLKVTYVLILLPTFVVSNHEFY